MYANIFLKAYLSIYLLKGIVMPEENLESVLASCHPTKSLWEYIETHKERYV